LKPLCERAARPALVARWAVVHKILDQLAGFAASVFAGALRFELLSEGRFDPALRRGVRARSGRSGREERGGSPRKGYGRRR